MKKSEWIYHLPTYQEERRSGIEPIFTLGNGYMSGRGFFEEETEGIFAQGGIYMAGVFGGARYTPWKGKGRELANTPNIFAVNIQVDGENVGVEHGRISEFQMDLHMDEGSLVRSYVWKSVKGGRVKIEFERFISVADIHLCGQKVRITPLDGDPEIRIRFWINPNVTNLNLVSSEPLPVQPGVKHLEIRYQKEDTVVTEINDYQEIQIAQRQIVSGENRERLKSDVIYRSEAGKCREFSKLIYTATSLDSVGDPLDYVNGKCEKSESYREVFFSHKRKWETKWRDADIRIEGNSEDQISLRYNLFQLMQAAPEHTSRQSIGARGLTGEMYEGCIFWDTEIFMLPFFTYSNPAESRRLLEFRYHTLEEAKEHARNNWFEGAMYPWQVSETGIEQTPQGVGAYYSIHVTADIAYAVLEYYNATADLDFMLHYGTEILIETARFWVSRAHKNTVTGEFDILAVRGPNEYDVIVNNNLYTNMMAQENINLAIKMIDYIRENERTQWQSIAEKTGFCDSEIPLWQEVMGKLTICYDREKDLYEEDDMYFQRVPLDMKKAKPTAKRIIDTTIPYEGLMLYQVSKQADVLHLMKNLHWKFTKEQKIKAWDYYVPKTCFDSSLAYSMHSVMAAQLGKTETAYSYFKTSANLDIQDVQLNTVSGLHFANFGGTWQAAVFGFAGIRVDKDGIILDPHLPDEWKKMSFGIWYQNIRIEFEITKEEVVVSTAAEHTSDLRICISDRTYRMDQQKIIHHFRR